MDEYSLPWRDSDCIDQWFYTNREVEDATLKAWGVGFCGKERFYDADIAEHIMPPLPRLSIPMSSALLCFMWAGLALFPDVGEEFLDEVRMLRREAGSQYTLDDFHEACLQWFGSRCSHFMTAGHDGLYVNIYSKEEDQALKIAARFKEKLDDLANFEAQDVRWWEMV